MVNKLENGKVRLLVIYDMQSEQFSREIELFHRALIQKGDKRIELDTVYLGNLETNGYDRQVHQADVILNLVSYFPESHDLDFEENQCVQKNVKTLENLLLDLQTISPKTKVINVNQNNAFYLSLNDNINAGKLYAYCTSMLDQRRVLKNIGTGNWVSIDLGLVLDKAMRFITGLMITQPIYLNDSVQFQPVTMPKALFTLFDVVHAISTDSLDLERFYHMGYSGTSVECTMFEYYQSINPDALVQVYGDSFLEQSHSFRSLEKLRLNDSNIYDRLS